MPLKKFYGRKLEEEIFREELDLADRLGSGRLIAAAGRRRLGKTELVHTPKRQTLPVRLTSLTLADLRQSAYEIIEKSHASDFQYKP